MARRLASRTWSSEPCEQRIRTVALPVPPTRGLLAALVGVALAFFVVSVAAVALDHPGSVIARLNTANEANAPTWYSTVLWLGAAALAAALHADARRDDRGARRWALLAGLFARSRRSTRPRSCTRPRSGR